MRTFARTAARLHKRKSQRQRARENASAIATVERAERMLYETNLLFCAVLAQKGGSVVVTQGTLDQCLRNLGNLGFSMKASEEQQGEYTITLLTGEETATENVGYAAPSDAAATDMPSIVITG